MQSKGSVAVNRMWRMKKDQVSGVEGWCLRVCRTAWDLPADELSAIKEWESIPNNLKSDKWWLAPVGAPHFWAVGKHGHVALQSHIKGLVWSTDAPTKDYVGRVAIWWFNKHWNAEYLGWSKEFQNKVLPLKEKTKKGKK